LNNFTGFGEIDGGDSVCILGGPRIQAVQSRYGSTVSFGGWMQSRIVSIVIVIDYLAVRSGSAPDDWVVISGMYGIHLKHGQYLQPINFNNLKPQLICVVGIVWDTSITCGNWCSLT